MHRAFGGVSGCLALPNIVAFAAAATPGGAMGRAFDSTFGCPRAPSILASAVAVAAARNAVGSVTDCVTSCVTGFVTGCPSALKLLQLWFPRAFLLFLLRLLLCLWPLPWDLL